MPDSYNHARRDLAGGFLLAVWLLVCDAALKAIARIGGCGKLQGVSADILGKIYEAPVGCSGSDMAGEAIRLQPAINDGALFGLGGGALGGFMGQVYALALLAVATVASISLLRWKWRSTGDPKALGALWGGAFALAIPRLLGSGAGLAELDMFGFALGIGDLAFVWGLIWVVGRFFGESRA